MRWFEHMPDKRAGLIEKGMEIMTAGNSAKAVGKIPHYTLTISIKRKKKDISGRMSSIRAAKTTKTSLLYC